MWIVNQDREEFIKMEGDFCVLPVTMFGKLMAWNLKLNGRLIGTFDTFLEIAEEIEKIKTCKLPVYFVNGFSNFRG